MTYFTIDSFITGIKLQYCGLNFVHFHKKMFILLEPCGKDKRLQNFCNSSEMKRKSSLTSHMSFTKLDHLTYLLPADPPDRVLRHG